MRTKIILGSVMGFLLAIGLALLIFFTLIKNKMCNGEFINCPSGNVKICAKKGTNAGQFCPKRTGGFKSGITNNNLRQNNPQVIARQMNTECRKEGNISNIGETSKAVNCAVKLSGYENELGGWPLFGTKTGDADDRAQDRWCLGLDPGLPLNKDLSDYKYLLSNCDEN